MARRFVQGPRRSVRRLTEWVSTTPETVFQGLSAATAILDSSFTGADPEILIRVVGELMVSSDQTAGTEDPFGAVGICIVSDQVFAQGVASILTPYTDAESDLWVMHQFWAAPMLVASAIGFQNIAQRYTLSSKAMRKVSPDETVCLVIENGAQSPNAAKYRLDVRILSKLS